MSVSVFAQKISAFYEQNEIAAHAIAFLENDNNITQ